MLIYLILLFTVLPVMELALLIKVGTIIGVFNTVLIVFLTGILGSYLARLQGFVVINKIQENLSRGIMPSSELIDGVMILAGGVLLIIPGFITDVVGLFLLIPWTRTLVKILLKRKLKSMAEKGRVVHFTSINSKQTKHYDDIDLN